MPMLKDMRGVNALTVLFSPSGELRKTKVFFCPYRRNIVGSYQGNVVSIQPGYDSEQTPLFFIRPQRQKYEDNINYIFAKSKNGDTSTTFWIQDQYFDRDAVRKYYCYSCQNPQLYYDEAKAVDYKTKKEVNAGTSYLCDNCKTSLTFMGIVAIKEPLLESEL
jgi:hypothetical protein